MAYLTLNRSKLNISDETEKYIRHGLVPRFKFGEYFYFNKFLISKNKLFTNVDAQIATTYLRLKRKSCTDFSTFNLIGLINSGCYGKCYLIKRKKCFYYFKTLNSKLLAQENPTMDYMTLNYIALLRERDALLNCGGLWTPKVMQTFTRSNLPIVVAIEAVIGWTLCESVHVLHSGNCSRSLIYTNRNKMTIKAQSALLTGSADFIEPIDVSLIPIITFWMAELLVAIRFIHQQGILHRNLRPDNIYVTSRGHIKLTDFSLNTELYEIQSDNNSFSLNCANCLTELTEAIMTPEPFDTRRRIYSNRNNYPFKIFGATAYSAPELHASSTIAEYTTKCDYWSAGCIFFYMLFMINPFDASNSSLEDAKLNLCQQSLLRPNIILKRCMYAQSAKELLLDHLCVPPDNRLDDNLSEAKWMPETLEFFANIDFKSLLTMNAPFKPVIPDPSLGFVSRPIDADDMIYEILDEYGASVLQDKNKTQSLNSQIRSPLCAKAF